MKLLIGTTALVTLFATQAFAFTLADVAGKYQITSDALGAVNVMTITTQGKVTLFEKSIDGNFTCKGNATMTNNVVNSSVKCENGMSFSQEINLSTVTNLSQFSAPVFTSLLGQTVPMNFKKIK